MKTHSEELGRFKFDISYRRFNGDEGLSIKVDGPVAEQTHELLRFDCFLKTPHYHVGVYDQNKITSIKNADAVEWSLDAIHDRFREMVEAAGGEQLNEQELRQLDVAQNQLPSMNQLVRLNEQELRQLDVAVANVSDFSRKLVAQEQAAN